MTEDEQKAFGCLLGIPALLIAAPIIAVLYGWTLTVLWAWFISPTFNLPPLTVLPAIGLMLVIQLLTAKKATSKGDDKSPLIVIGDAVVFALIYCALSLAEGYVVHLLMTRV